ncbi:fungal-specific transcription factor domain-containing protein [Helicostylum pulchrum]|nr:fungal-specific transcription factor domain-containing protein [Helicostylum pulchrum]
MIQEPPPLPFPSLKKLQIVARESLEALNTKTRYRFCAASVAAPEVETKKAKKKKDACEVCRRKKVKCDINNEKEDRCTKPNCSCDHHIPNNNTNDKNDKIAQGKIPVEPIITTTTDYYNRNSSTPDFVPSTTGFRKAGLLSSGHYAGETSFCAYFQPGFTPRPIKHESQYPTLETEPVRVPNITYNDQLYLIDVYYQNLNPFFPIINKAELLSQLHKLMNLGETYLSPLFFYALFARASHVATDRIFTEASQQTFESLGDDCVTYVSALVGKYQDAPRISTVLALIIMANHLEQTKLPQNLTRSWLWAGEAFRIALDLGIHRASITEKDSPGGQLCIRTFWLAYITDCTISMTYGRPSATEEKVLDVTAPQTIPDDDGCTAEWLQGLNSLISLSKIAARVIKFNYCPPPPFKVSEPVKRHNAFLASVDSWLTDIMHPHNEPDTPPSTLPNTSIPQTLVSKRMNFQKQMFFYTNLILLHRPYVNDVVPSRTCTRPSYDICSYAAIIITDNACGLNDDDLIYHSKSPMVAYALVMAMRVHIMNASHTSSADKFSSEQNYQRGLATLKKLPQYLNQCSLLFNALTDLTEQYNGRLTLVREPEDEERTEVMIPDWTCSAQDIPSPPYADKRRGSTSAAAAVVGESSKTAKKFKLYVPDSVPSRPKKPRNTAGSGKKTSKASNRHGQIVFHSKPKQEAPVSQPQPEPAQPLPYNTDVQMNDVSLPQQTHVTVQQQQQQLQQQLIQQQQQQLQQQQLQHQQQLQEQQQQQHQQQLIISQQIFTMPDLTRPYPSWFEMDTTGAFDESSVTQSPALASSSSSPSIANVQSPMVDFKYNAVLFAQLFGSSGISMNDPMLDANYYNASLASSAAPVDNNYDVVRNPDDVSIELSDRSTYPETSSVDVDALNTYLF